MSNTTNTKLENSSQMDKFIVITWPEIQNYFEIRGFRENSLLINDGALYDEYGDSAYMIKESWLDSL